MVRMVKEITLRCPICTKPARITHVATFLPDFVKEEEVEQGDLAAIVNFECMTCEPLIGAQATIPADYEIENQDWVDYSRLTKFFKDKE